MGNDDIAQIARGKSSFPFTNYYLQEISDGITAGATSTITGFSNPLETTPERGGVLYQSGLSEKNLEWAYDTSKQVLHGSLASGATVAFVTSTPVLP